MKPDDLICGKCAHEIGLLGWPGIYSDNRQCDRCGEYGKVIPTRFYKQLRTTKPEEADNAN